MPLLRSTRGAPLNELYLRTKDVWDEMSEELARLLKEEVITVDGDLPESEDQVQGSRSVVSLTRFGVRRVLR